MCLKRYLHPDLLPFFLIKGHSFGPWKPHHVLRSPEPCPVQSVPLPVPRPFSRRGFKLLSIRTHALRAVLCLCQLVSLPGSFHRAHVADGGKCLLGQQAQGKCPLGSDDCGVQLQVPFPALLFASCVPLSQLLNLSGPVFVYGGRKGGS